MKTVLIAGKLDEGAKELYDRLAPFCRPCLCPDDASAIPGMLKLFLPELVVAPLSDEDSEPGNVFFLLEKELHRPPIVAIGSVHTQGALIRDRWLPNKRVVFLQRPVSLDDVASCVRRSLGEKENDEDLRKKILIVDDDPDMLRYLYRMLSKHWNVSAVTSGARAIVAASKSRPDLILLDYDMPLMDGGMTFRVLRAEEDTREIPIVFLTGLSDPDSVAQVLALHPQGYLLKPPSEERIVAKLTSLLGDG